MNVIQSKKAPEPVGAYVHARRVGSLLFLAGIGPRRRGETAIPGVYLDAEGNVVAHDIDVQTTQCIENVKMILEEAGSSLSKVIDVQVFLTDMRGDFPRYNKVFESYFKDIPVTRTTVGVTALPTPISVEFKVIAEA